MRYTRRYNVVPAVAFGVVGAAGLGAGVGSWIGANPAYALTAVALVTAMLAAVVTLAGDRHPHARFGPGNYVTTLRVILAALLAGLIGRPAAPGVLWFAVGLTAVAATLDGVDGWLARRSGMASDFGARFDMETDAALIMVLSVLVWQHEKAGAWVLLCGLMRYGFVAAGWWLRWLARPLRSTLRGKAVAVGQLAGLSVALAPIVPVPYSAAVAAVTLAALAWSFAIDVRGLAHDPA